MPPWSRRVLRRIPGDGPSQPALRRSSRPPRPISRRSTVGRPRTGPNGRSAGSHSPRSRPTRLSFASPGLSSRPHSGHPEQPVRYAGQIGSNSARRRSIGMQSIARQPGWRAPGAAPTARADSPAGDEPGQRSKNDHEVAAGRGEARPPGVGEPVRAFRHRCRGRAPEQPSRARVRRQSITQPSRRCLGELRLRQFPSGGKGLRAGQLS